MPRPTRRSSTVTTASAVCRPIRAETVYLPGRSATNAPSASIWAAPVSSIASTDQRTAASRTGCPPAPAACAVKRTTSPVRTDCEGGVMLTRDTVPGSTSTACVAVAAPAFAVIVARPGATAVSRPSGVIAATRASLEEKVRRSSRRSFCSL